MKGWKNVIFVITLYIFSTNKCTFGDTNVTAKHILQICRTDSLWAGAHEETPLYMKEKYTELETQYKTSLHAITSTSIIQACIQSESIQSVLKFAIQPTPANPSRISFAELKIYLTPEQLMTSDFPMVRVYQIVHNQPLNEPDAHRLLTVYYPVMPLKIPGQWVALNVLTAVREWTNNRRQNLGFLITGIQWSAVHRPLLLITYNLERGLQSHVPFEVQGWNTASSNIFDESVQTNLCRRESWSLNLTHWGMLAPTALDIGQCSGSCRITESQLSHHAVHTALTSILAIADETLKQPCCVPAEYGPAPIMYRAENGNFIIRVLSDLVVQSCICK